MTAPAATRDIAVNGIRLSVTEAGEGPLVLLCHGWPELAHAWRHQIPALAAAGYRVAAPDMRGFGRSEAPAEQDAYSILHLVGDMVGLVQALGATEAVIVGHDWGASVAWHAALLRPDLFRAVAALSVPFRSRGPAAPVQALIAAGRSRFYWVYFQDPGRAEAEFEADPEETLRRILGGLSATDGPRDPNEVLMLPEGGGFLDMLRRPEALPAWLSQEDLATMATAFRASGFRGGLNYYRNLDRNWALTAPWVGASVRQPALFVAGRRDPVILSPFGRQAMEAMPRHVPGLRRSVLIEGAGHWIQQERPAEVTAALLDFLGELG
jgi:pimeloyl-ACP methyl ester carboxylesterase